ncbi:hypothetical protein [Komagataeibacter saccharivorans]|uniref:hypothetical protein n=1 Tax=Komagataeibacter saccharivorans TaxID=265959 RepID=UPI0011AF2E10|nr:hypothetical protein [Komagataeibacter saccharivorans]
MARAGQRSATHSAQPSTTGKDTISHAYSHAAAVSPGGTTYGVMILCFEKDIMTGMAFRQVSTD